MRVSTLLTMMAAPHIGNESLVEGYKRFEVKPVHYYKNSRFEKFSALQARSEKFLNKDVQVSQEIL